MLKIAFVFLFCLFLHASLKGQVTLKIIIDDIESNTGKVILDFRNAQNKTIKDFTKQVKNNQCIITINNLKPGKYAYRFFHDANKNVKLDMNWVGIPLEGYGFSNKTKFRFLPPAFKETVFEVTHDTTVVSSMFYIRL